LGTSAQKEGAVLIVVVVDTAKKIPNQRTNFASTALGRKE
jgi:hypothetical protein